MGRFAAILRLVHVPLTLLLLGCLAVGCGNDTGRSTTASTTQATTDTTATTATTPTATTPAAPDADNAAAIVVERPAAGDAARSPLHVSGTANVFEAVLFVELRDGGRAVATQRVMATAGTGTRGTFVALLRFDAGGLKAPTLTAFTKSPRDGRRENVVSVPLQPAT